ncbi:MAG: hypothetical protein IJL77_05415 [Clostridia bacterium]|nr:hypothetical protein [Clostridia bacterium]
MIAVGADIIRPPSGYAEHIQSAISNFGSLRSDHIATPVTASPCHLPLRNIVALLA